MGSRQAHHQAPQDSARPPIGQGQEGLIAIQAHPIYTMDGTGLVHLAVATPTSRGASTTAAASTSTSSAAPRDPQCAPQPFPESRMSEAMRNQRNQTPPRIKINEAV